MLLKLLNERLEKAYEVDQIKFLEEKLLQLNDATAVCNKLQTTRAIVNELSFKRKNTKASKVKKADGTKINSTDE